MKVQVMLFTVTTLAIISVFGVGIVYGQTAAISQSPSISAYENNPSETRVKLRSLLEEHTILLDDTNLSRYDTRPGFQTAQTMLKQNGEVLASVIENLYGADVKKQFLPIWEDHHQLFILYTDAVKNNDTNKQNRVKKELDTFIIQIANLFASQLPGSDKNEIIDIFQDHVYYSRLVIENHAVNDFENEYMNKHSGFDHAGMMGDILSGISNN